MSLVGSGGQLKFLRRTCPGELLGECVPECVEEPEGLREESPVL